MATEGSDALKIIGSYVSPYVRKVLACLNLKGLAYEIDPITPFFGDEVHEWQRLLADPHAHVHIYGKGEARPGRKMGHVTRLVTA